MGWGTTFKPEIYLSREQFSTDGALEDEISELEKSIERTKQTIAMYVAASPKDIIPEEWKEQGVDFLKHRIDENMEMLEEDLIKLYKLRLLNEYCDENNISPEKLYS
jgi:hypothetical protein